MIRLALCSGKPPTTFAVTKIVSSPVKPFAQMSTSTPGELKKGLGIPIGIEEETITNRIIDVDLKAVGSRLHRLKIIADQKAAVGGVVVEIHHPQALDDMRASRRIAGDLDDPMINCVSNSQQRSV